MVFLPEQVLEVRMISGRLRIARKVKQRDAGDLQRKAEPVPRTANSPNSWVLSRNQTLPLRVTGPALRRNR